MPGVLASAASTASALAAVEMTWTGSPEPAGKYLASTFWAVTEGWVPRKDWAVVSVPNLKPIRPREHAASKRAVTTRAGGGGGVVASRPRARRPGLVGGGEPYFGLTGQNIHRPKM